MIIRILAVLVILIAPASAQDAPNPARLDHTYSIVARDAETGVLGVAVQTHSFAVGNRVPWARAGVGAVATQSFTLPEYGPLGLDLMAAGKTAEAALAALIAADEGRAVRQVGMVDARGNAANYTGANAIEAHCRITGDGFAVQANLMERDTVCAAMAAAFKKTQGTLGTRLLAALHAAQGEGGDIRGMQSAALKVVNGEAGLAPWEGVILDLRVDDHDNPLAELARLMDVARANTLEGEAGDLLQAGDFEAAMGTWARARALVPDDHELIFWQAVSLVRNGHEDAALPIFAEAFARHPLWRETLPRLVPAGLFPDDPALMERVLAVGE